MIRRPVVVLCGAGILWLAVACLDVSSPVKGISAISPVILPTPSVVVGDVMRDTSGAIRPLSVVVYGPNGDTVRDAIIKFFAIDSSHGLFVDSLTGAVRGDALSPTASVVARVTPASGSGLIQTLNVALPVVPVPDSAIRDTTDSTFVATVGQTDTLASPLISKPLIVTVKSAAGVAVQSYPVIFKLTQPPDSAQFNGPLVVLTNSAGRDTTVGITNSSGQALIYLRFRQTAINPDQLGVLLLHPDTVQVKFLVRSKGDTLTKVTPSNTFVISVSGKPPT